MLNVYSRARDGETLLSRSFRAKEFACKDGTDPLFVDSELVQVLHRQEDLGAPKTESAARALRALNPEVRLEPHQEALSPANALRILGDYEVVVNGCDNFPTRYLVNDACVLLGRPLVDASILRFEGRLATYLPGRGCYRCLFPTPPPPGMVPSCAEGGILGAVAGIMGSLQALETLKVLLGFGEPLADRLLILEGLAGTWRTLKRRRDPGCPVCGENPSIRTLEQLDLACGIADPAPEESMQIPQIQPEKAREELEARPEIQVVDVREAEAWRRYHLPRAVSIPLDQLARRAGELDSSRPVFTVCARGVRSLEAARILVALGFGQVTSVALGTEGWKEKNLPLES